jgi:type IV secretory pathway TraG/TraD family ATPase VirD4
MRGSIFGTAKEMLRCLTEPASTKWVTRQPGVREFKPAEFVKSTDTLYLLSKGGPGSPAPLIAALTYATLTAGERAAETMPGRRLDPPMQAILDEVANICRIRRLPALYSHFGSRGLPIDSYLQSYAQGVGVWGQDGMESLYSAATILTYLGGVKDTRWLKTLSDLIGQHDVSVRSVSHSHRSGRSTTTQLRQEPILSVSDLAALPFGRMVLAPSGARPVLGRTCPWQTGPHADAVRASLAKWDPHGERYDPTLQPVPVDDETTDHRGTAMEGK